MIDCAKKKHYYQVSVLISRIKKFFVLLLKVSFAPSTSGCAFLGLFFKKICRAVNQANSVVGIKLRPPYIFPIRCRYFYLACYVGTYMFQNRFVLLLICDLAKVFEYSAFGAEHTPRELFAFDIFSLMAFWQGDGMNS